MMLTTSNGRVTRNKKHTHQIQMSAFIDSILLAWKEAADDASALRECARRLQQHNRDRMRAIFYKTQPACKASGVARHQFCMSSYTTRRVQSI